MKKMNLVSTLDPEVEKHKRISLKSVSPDDGKYSKETQRLGDFLSAEAEWRMFASVQRVFLETRVEFGQAQKKHLDEMKNAVSKFDPLNAALLEGKLRHDQLAVLEELGRHVSPETKALLHPGTTSYDVVDTARAFLFRECWDKVVRPEVSNTINKLCSLAEENSDIIQAGRTHLQRTSPVPFMTTLAGYAARIAERTVKCDTSFGDLRGKVSGIVGTGAGIDVVVGEGKSIEFENRVLEKLGLKPDYTATQVTQKEKLADVGHGIVTLMHVLGDLANDMRILYSSEINEVTSRDAERRLAGSSADASKNNPIHWENISGKAAVVESGMRVLYEMIKTDLQRDLRSSVQGRYQPHQMIAQTYESFFRVNNRCLNQLSVNRDVVARNLDAIRNFPSEALTAITRAQGWVHPEYGVGHSAVTEFAKIAKSKGISLMEAAQNDEHFKELYKKLTDFQRSIVDGKIELYIGSAKERARMNIDYSRSVAVGKR